MKRLFTRGALAALLTVLSLSIFGCGSSVDPALVESAGKHGNVLEANTALLEKNALTELSLDYMSRLDTSGDPKNASESTLKKVRAANQRNIEKVTKFRRTLTAANVKLRRTPMPDFSEYLDPTSEAKKFSTDYAKTTQVIRRSGTLVIAASTIATKTFEELSDFIDEWLKYKNGGDAASFRAASEESMAALTKMGTRIDQIKKKADIAGQLDALVGSMANAASNDSQLGDLVTALREDYPNSFLPKHLVEK